MMFGLVGTGDLGAIGGTLIGLDDAILSTATAWWTPAIVAGGDMTDQIGSLNLADTGTVQYLDDGTHHYAEIRASDYFAAASTAALDPAAGMFSLVMVTTPRTSVAGTHIFASKRAGGALGWNIFANAGTLTGTLDDDVAAARTTTAGTVSVGTRYTIGVVRDATTWRLVKDATVSTPVSAGSATIANAEEFRIARGGGATVFTAEQDLYGVAWFKGIALSDAEVVDVGVELLAAAAL